MRQGFVTCFPTMRQTPQPRGVHGTKSSRSSCHVARRLWEVATMVTSSVDSYALRPKTVPTLGSVAPQGLPAVVLQAAAPCRSASHWPKPRLRPGEPEAQLPPKAENAVPPDRTDAFSFTSHSRLRTEPRVPKAPPPLSQPLVRPIERTRVQLRHRHIDLSS